MGKKEYAPLVSKEVYRFSKETYKIFRVNVKKTEEDMLYAVYCPECGHTHTVYASHYSRHRTDYLRKFLCPKCGYRNEVYETYKWETPDSAHIFHMADGSCAVSLYVKQHRLFIANDCKTPMHVAKEMRIRYIFNANGQTYYKMPVNIDTNRSIYKGATVQTATYCTNATAGGSYPIFNNYMQTLEREGFLPKNAIARNRFQNVSEKMLYALYDLIRSFERHTTIGRKITEAMRLIPRDASDEEALHILIARAGIKGGKKFRRMMADDPYRTFIRSIWFKMIGMKDINSFYKLQRRMTYVMANGTSHICMLAKKILKRFGETVLANMLSSESNCNNFYDVTIYIEQLKEYLPEEEIEKLFCRNVKMMHDRIVQTMTHIREQLSTDADIHSLLQKNEELETGEIDEAYIPIVQKTIIEKAEEITNNPIVYGEEEQKLEEEIDNVTFYLPKDTDHLINAGDRLHNCVGHLYRMKAYRKKCIIVLMKQEDKFVGCIEICDGIIRQAYGPCNESFSEVAQQSFNQWISRHNLSKTEENSILTDVSKEYERPEFKDIIQKLKTAAADTKIEWRNRVRRPFYVANAPF